jgi:hypothetical protein
MGPWWPLVRWLIDTKRWFPDVFASRKSGFVAAQFCFVAPPGTKHSGYAKETRHPGSGSMADEK